MACFKRIPKGIDLLVKSAAINLEIASPVAVPWKPPSRQSGESGSESRGRVKHHDPARRSAEPFSGAQRQRIKEALGALSSGLSLFPCEDEAIAWMQRSILQMEALLSVKH